MNLKPSMVTPLEVFGLLQDRKIICAYLLLLARLKMYNVNDLVLVLPLLVSHLISFSSETLACLFPALWLVV